SEVNNVGKIVQVYVANEEKTEENLVITINFKDLTSLDEALIVEMPNLDESDFSHIDWAKDHIEQAMLMGIIDATPTFRPTDSITRAEFAKIVCESFGIEANEGDTEPFHDVDDAHWHQKYITALYNAGIIEGKSAQLFHPGDAITREEASKIMSNSYAFKGEILPFVEVIEDDEVVLKHNAEVVETADTTILGIHLDSVTKFADDKEIATWADAAVANLAELKVINGYTDNTFKPKAEITRAEALVMVMRMNG
ncbi:MAG: S-layer homology domain-containing protein, partial [Peptostreptococcaceae bacterium]